MGYSSKQTCPRCGRVLVGFQPCPNCIAGGYSDSYQAYGQGISSPTVGPRLVLLLGAVVLLSVLVFLIAPRGGSKREQAVVRNQEPGEALGLETAGASKRSSDEEGNAYTPDVPMPVAQKFSRKGKRAANTEVPSPDTTSTRDEDEEFWRKKLERDLREVGEWKPTEEEKAYMEQMRWQDHFSLSGQARISDYYLRRPELTGGRR